MGNNINMLKKRKKHEIFVCFSCFNPLDRQPVAFKTLKHSINYNPHIGLAKIQEKCAFSNPINGLFAAHKSLMTYKAFL